MHLRDQIRAALTPELVRPGFEGSHRMSGHCYVASEAYFHLAGGKVAGLVARRIKHEGVTHWWLEDRDGNVIDLTAEQFYASVPYHKGRSTGFLTRRPSKRAQIVIDRVKAASC